MRRARDAEEIKRLPAEAIRGAAAYLQAYQLVTHDNPSKTPRALRRLASQYLNMTAMPSLTGEQKKAAKLAGDVLKQLS